MTLPTSGLLADTVRTVDVGVVCAVIRLVPALMVRAMVSGVCASVDDVLMVEPVTIS